MKLFLFLAVLFIVSCSLTPGSKSKADDYFLTEVKPVLQQQCLRCHNGTLPRPVLNLTSRVAAFKHSASGQAYILPGDPDHSLLVTAVQRPGLHPKLMPRTDLSLTDDQIGMLREWIEDGAFWPDGASGTLHSQSSPEYP